jgi:hypothetical protein
MPKAEITIECLWLFARDEENRTVHLLAPSTETCRGGVHGHLQASNHAASAAAPTSAAVPRHTTRLVSGKGAAGPVIDGWALVLDGMPKPANMNLTVTDGPELADLTVSTGRFVRRKFIADSYNREVTARVTLRGGTLTFLDADLEWIFDGKRREIAARAKWVFDDLADLQWTYIGPPEKAPAAGSPVPATLAAIGLDPLDGVYRFTLRCAVETPDNTPARLKPEEVTQHFTSFDALLGRETRRTPRLRVDLDVASGPGVYVSCGSGQGRLSPT